MKLLLLIIILSIFLPSVNYVKPVASISMEKNTSEPNFFSQFDTIINNTQFFGYSYKNQKILIIGNTSVLYPIVFNNCNLTFFINPAENIYSSIYLDSIGSLNINNSIISYYNLNPQLSNTSDLYIQGSHNSHIIINNSLVYLNPLNNQPRFFLNYSDGATIQNSIFFHSNNIFNLTNSYGIVFINSMFMDASTSLLNIRNNLKVRLVGNYFSAESTDLTNIQDLKDLLIGQNNFIFPKNNVTTTQNTPSVINITSTKTVNITNNYIVDIDSFFSANNLQNANITFNYFNHFSTGFSLHQVTNLFMEENEFRNGTTALLANDLNSFTHFRVMLNNFYNITYPLLINPFNQSEIVKNGDFSHNYYYGFDSIDFNNDGFDDQPYINHYFIDNYTLSNPYQDYYIVNGQIVFYANAVYLIDLNIQTRVLLGPQWQILAGFYLLVLISPMVLYLVIRKRI